MAPASAYIGQPPASNGDILTVKAFYVFIDMVGKVPINKGFSVGPKRLRPPPNDPIHQEATGPAMRGYCVFFILLMLFSTITRLFLRARHGRERLGWDDLLIAIATVVAIGSPLLTIVSTYKAGTGKHTFDVTYQELSLHFSLIPVRNLLFYVSLGMVKMSIACFYMRLNGFTSRKWMLTHRFLLFLSFSTVAIVVGFNVWSCHPMSAQFNFKNLAYMDHSPKCIDSFVQLIVLNLLHMVTDASLLIVPIAMLWKVQMKRSTKFRVWIVGMVGCLNIVFSIVRTIENKLSVNMSDPFYTQYQINVWTTLELSLGVITASLPALSIPFTNLIRHLKSLVTRTPNDREKRQYGFGNQRDRRFLGGRRKNGVTTVSSLHSVDHDSITNFSCATTTVDYEMGEATTRQMVEEALERKTAVDVEGEERDLELGKSSTEENSDRSTHRDIGDRTDVELGVAEEVDRRDFNRGDQG